MTTEPNETKSAPPRAPSAPPAAPSTPPPPHKRAPDLLSLIGWFVTGASFLIGLVLVCVEVWLVKDNPYFSLVTYTITPAGMNVGLGMVALSLLLRYRRRLKGKERKILPILDLNSRKVRITLLMISLGLVLFFTVSSVGVYRAYHFTESRTFCGEVCHQVMHPEFSALSRSPHARVDCVECHIGPGADWYVRAKFSGFRQVYAVLFHQYELPIKTPIANLRPARETCEECHWPAKFEGSVERVLWRYWYDRDNTPSRYHLLMKVGGVNPNTGRPEGIHWHSSSDQEVRYWARDEQRNDIPWVEVVHPDGTKDVYSDGSLASPPPASEMRAMDCMDCHNRPAHIYRSPTVLVDGALGEGRLPRDLPYLKRTAVELLSGHYASREEAHAAIYAGFRNRYPLENGLTERKREATIRELISMFDGTNFPEQGVDWRTYQNNIGHKTTPGCFRCHDGKHRSQTAPPIARQCNLCHEFIHQAHGREAYGPVNFVYGPFEHPGRQATDYDEEKLCSECHNERVGWYPGHGAEGAAPEPPPVEPGPVRTDVRSDAGAAADQDAAAPNAADGGHGATRPAP